LKTDFEIKGLIFHIIHGSLVDGYGVRTTIFLKGCPLKCAWCCNPEGQTIYPELKVSPALCNLCGNCLAVCSCDAIRLDTNAEPDERVIVDHERCTDCLKCCDACDLGVMDVFGTYYTVKEVLDIVKKDEVFYRISGGGITIGGGEPTMQAEFTLALIRECKKNYLHTAIDTCGHVSDELGLQVLKEADLLLFDIKGLDPARHKLNTGVSNELLLRNLRYLDRIRKPIIIRLPLIPKYTDTLEKIENIADFLAELNSIERVDLLNYHEYGGVKYRQLGKFYGLETTSLSNERLNEIKKILEQRRLNVQIGG
jgi:pyruvate formate lyase activating enzyme